MRTIGTAPSPSGTERIALWDNARLLLILLVVFGHCIESIRGTAAVDAVYAVVYAFHIPAFLLVSGWFSRSDRLDATALRGSARLLVTWLIAEVAWAAGRALIGDAPFSATFLVRPGWTLWFLVSLFLMRLLLPYVAQFRWPLLGTVLVSLAAGLSTEIGTGFSASRTLALLPFFVLGWWLRGRGVGAAAWFVAPGRRLRIVAGIVAAAGVTAVLLLTLLPGFTDQLLFWRRSYDGMGFADVEGLVLRGTMLVVATGLSLSLLILLPRGRHWFSALGGNTLPVYLLHAPLVFALRRTHLDDAIGGTPVSILVMLLVAAAITLPLSSPLVARLMRPVLEPDLLFRRELPAR